MTLEAYERFLKITWMGNRTVRKAHVENQRKGIPNVYARNGKLFYIIPLKKFVFLANFYA